MQSPSSTDSRIAEFAKLAETKGDIASLQQHLREVVEGDAFKGSHRSGQFLQYIVAQAIAGHFESLKERVIGVELFGRSTSYDTGDDAIVRVTASDVRKRLVQHYGRYGANSEFRISLPLGSYIPEISRDLPQPVNRPHVIPPAAHHNATSVTQPEATATSSETSVTASIHPEVHDDPHQRRRRGWLIVCLVVMVANVALWGIFWNHFARKAGAAASTLPWSVLL